MSNRAIAITGMGVVSALGSDLTKTWQQLLAGTSGTREIRRFEVTGLKTRFAATSDLILCDQGESRHFLQNTRLIAEHACDEAMEHAEFPPGLERRPELVLSAPVHEIDLDEILARSRFASVASYEELLAFYAQDLQAEACPADTDLGSHLIHRYGLGGSPTHIDTACASGATILQQAVEMIRRGQTRAVLAVGADIVRREMLVRFGLLSALSTRNNDPQSASRPFSRTRDGFVLGEGAAAMVLEDEEYARERGARVLGFLIGAGEAGDCYHRTRSHPSGAPLVACMSEALRDAGLSAADIGYVNAHGTSTFENDRMEALAIGKLFGSRALRVPVSSSKSMIGHTIKAAGIIEACITLQSLNDKVAHPTINHLDPDPEIPLDVVPNRAKEIDAVFGLSNSFGFGGQNASLVLAREDFRRVG